MLVRLKKTGDGAVMSIVREDGSVAVHRSAQSAFFAGHDLMHVAVESTLGLRRGFLGLLARGWSFEAFVDHDDPRYKELPAEALLAERLVDVFTRAYCEPAWRDEEIRGVWFEDVERELAQVLSGEAPGGMGTASLSRESILAVCRVYSGLIERWARTPQGEHFEVRVGLGSAGGSAG